MSDSFSERVLPSLPAWLLVPAGAVLVGIMLLPIGPVVAVIGALAVTLLLIGLLWRASPSILVRAETLAVDRARLPIQVISAVETLDRAQTERAMGPELDARAHLRHRAWANSAVKITLEDPEDPTPYWLISTRRPEELAEALGHPATTSEQGT
ncbi:MAG TPA: DUF3093 domain-containing protein [Candidatus Ruania gallistercoris]|uniref:DUF3093 domain-containing protein n=1 Tax=Candidatus Ruania gallistercoris TaxID=2838746 RepID=A0A9D2EHZ3_9MICO|nr:DUF3093 domain-containing protein [Candidatus Ruania gallistercoris]